MYKTRVTRQELRGRRPYERHSPMTVKVYPLCSFHTPSVLLQNISLQSLIPLIGYYRARAKSRSRTMHHKAEFTLVKSCLFTLVKSCFSPRAQASLSLQALPGLFLLPAIVSSRYASFSPFLSRHRSFPLGPRSLAFSLRFCRFPLLAPFAPECQLCASSTTTLA